MVYKNLSVVELTICNIHSAVDKEKPFDYSKGRFLGSG
jgi:hypothetical protein